MNQPMGHFDFLTGVQELSTIAGNTALAGNGVKSGFTYDVGNFNGILPQAVVAIPGAMNAGKAGPSIIRAFASSDVAGTLSIQHSPDGKTWFTDTAAASTAAVAADATKGVIVEAKITLRYVRAVLTNGAAAQTSVEFDTVILSI